MVALSSLPSWPHSGGIITPTNAAPHDHVGQHPKAPQSVIAIPPVP